MTKFVLATVLCAALSSATAQQSTLSKGPDYLDIGSIAKTTASSFALPDNGGNSTGGRAPLGSQRYQRVCYIITAADLAAAGFPTGIVFNSIGFSYMTGQSVPTTGNLKVYLQNTTDLGYSKPNSDWTNAATTGIIDNMTLVSDGSVTIPNAAGIWDIPFTGGSPLTYTGGGLYVAFEYQNPAGAISGTNSAWCNSTLANGTNGLRGAISTTAMPATLTTSSAFRPATRLGYPLANDASVIDIYALGKMPMTFGAPHTITARVANSGDNPWTNVNVTLNVTGANTFTNVQTLSLTPGNSAIVSFAAFTPAALGANTITVTVPNDDNNANNSKTYAQTVTTGTISHANGAAITGSVGYNTGAGLLGNRHTINGTGYVNAVNAFISAGATNVGNTMYGVVLSSTGVILGQSNNFVITNADLGTMKSFPIVVPPSITNADIYVTVAQTANVTGYFPVGTQIEPSPTRPSYFSFGLAGGAATPQTTLGRFVVEAEVATTPLSMDILELTATPRQKDIELTWKATNEAKHYFDIERSSNGKDFTNITTTGAADDAQNTFRYTDANAKKQGHNTLYYRIKQVDKAGRICYSPLATVNLDGSVSFEMSVVNPVHDHIRLSIYTAAEGNIDIRVTDMQGRTVYTGKRHCTIGTNIFSLDNTLQLHTGTYNVSINNGKQTLSRTIVQQ